MLDRGHQIDRVLAMLGNHEMLLALADTVFAGAGAVHGEGALGEPPQEGPGPCDLLGIIHHHENGGVEITVPNVPDDRRDEF